MWGQPHGGPWGGPVSVTVTAGKAGNFVLEVARSDKKFSLLYQERVLIEASQRIKREIPSGASNFRIQVALKETERTVFFVVSASPLSESGDLTYKFSDSSEVELDFAHVYFGSGMLEYVAGQRVEDVFFFNRKLVPVQVDILLARRAT